MDKRVKARIHIVMPEFIASIVGQGLRLIFLGKNLNLLTISNIQHYYISITNFEIKIFEIKGVIYNFIHEGTSKFDNLRIKKPINALKFLLKGNFLKETKNLIR